MRHWENLLDQVLIQLIHSLLRFFANSFQSLLRIHVHFFFLLSKLLLFLVSFFALFLFLFLGNLCSFLFKDIFTVSGFSKILKILHKNFQSHWKHFLLSQLIVKSEKEIVYVDSCITQLIDFFQVEILVDIFFVFEAIN